MRNRSDGAKEKECLNAGFRATLFWIPWLFLWRGLGEAGTLGSSSGIETRRLFLGNSNIGVQTSKSTIRGTLG